MSEDNGVQEAGRWQNRPGPAALEESPFERATYAKVTARLIPFLFLCYVLAYLDRVNVGFARLGMSAEPWFSEAAYSFGAGVFFLGYFFFEVPSNLALARFGARIWIARIMVMWGAISAAMMFVTSAEMFYALRFLLGVAEAGFFPGVILYLTFWYTERHRARMVASFMTAIALAGVFGGPLSGWLLASLDGLHGLRGWQWLFLAEGLPSMLVGVAVLFYLDDRPARARWLNEAERELLEARLAEEAARKAAQGRQRRHLREAFSEPRVWLLAAVYFGMVMGLYGISFWLPQLIRETLTANPAHIGLISALPWVCAAVAMVWVGRHSDRTGERRLHVALSAMVGAAAFAASAAGGLAPLFAFAAITVATAAVMASLSSFWSLPTAILSSTAAAAGIAWINSLGNLAGHLSPVLVNHLREAHGMGTALLALAASMLMAGVLVLAGFRGAGR